MMLWKLTAVLAFSLAWLSAPAARAGSGTDNRECCDYNGFYAGIGGGYSISFFEKGNAGDSAVANVRAGYRFLDFAALEAAAEFSPKFNGKSGVYNGVDTATVAGWLDGKLYPTARWTGFVQPYALVGVGWMWGHTASNSAGGHADEDNVFASRFGGGIDWYLTDHLFFTTDAAWVIPTGALSELKQLQFGGAVQYRF